MTPNEKPSSPERKAALESIRASFTGAESSTQCNRLLAALSRFPINSFEAMRFLDVYQVPARVLQLRLHGHKIVTHWQTVVTESGQTHRVGLYVLESEARK